MTQNCSLPETIGIRCIFPLLIELAPMFRCSLTLLRQCQKPWSYQDFILIQSYMQELKQAGQVGPAFKQAELALGLKRQLFDAKFVYSQQQISNPGAFLMPLFKQLPSQSHGFTAQDIQITHALACEMISEAARSLQVPICTQVLAQCLFHFFYARKSFFQYDMRDIMMGAMYLACKSEETLKKSYEIAMVFDYVFKAYENSKNLTPLQIGSTQYEHIKNITIMKAELDILFELGFQVYRLFQIPHRYFSSFISIFEKVPQYSMLCQTAWQKLNAIYYTTACLHYPHQVICAASIYISLRECQISFPEVPWWTLLQAYEQAIWDIEIMLKSLEMRKSQISFRRVSSRINELGEQNGIQNVFPVPYYRKIMLEKRDKLRQAKNQAHVKVSQIIQQTQVKQAQSETKKPQTNPSQHKNSQDIDSKKITVNKKDLLANISQKLQKHSNAIEKAVHKQQQTQQKANQDNSSDEEGQDLLMMAELRKKIQQKKQHQSKQN